MELLHQTIVGLLPGEPLMTGLTAVVAPVVGERGQSVSFAVYASAMADESTQGRASDKNTVKPNKKPHSQGLRMRREKGEIRGSNPRPSDPQSDSIGFEVGTRQELRRRRNPVAPTVAPANPKTDENEPVETDFSAALRMLAGLPLSDEERTEAVRRLLKATTKTKGTR